MVVWNLPVPSIGNLAARIRSGYRVEEQPSSAEKLAGTAPGLGVATDGRPSHDDLIRHHGVQSWRGTFARGSVSCGES